MAGNKRLPKLRVDVEEENPPSYREEDGAFVKDNLAVFPHGVVKKDSAKVFSINPEHLELHEVVGRGASSYVQRAIHVPTGTRLALKVVNVLDRTKRHQLVKEISALYEADCESLIEFYGAFYREGRITIALEYMDGGSWENILRQMGPIPEHVLANMTFQVLWGLAYLKHEHRVHRDIKPSNLVINSEGRVKLTDFGVSTDLKSSLAMAATFTGTWRYMSPERIMHHAYSYPSDIWSLGVCLMECALGRHPYGDSGTYVEMASVIVENPPPRVPADSAMTPEFVAVVESCLQKNPDDRPLADVLLLSPWLQKHGATSLLASVLNVKEWIDSLRPTRREGAAPPAAASVAMEDEGDSPGTAAAGGGGDRGERAAPGRASPASLPQRSAQPGIFPSMGGRRPYRDEEHRTRPMDDSL